MADFGLYVYPFRSRAERVLWTLQELRFDYWIEVIDFEKRKYPDFLNLNPDAKIPVLVREGRIYTESLAIMDYLNDIHPEKPLMPRDAESIYQVRKVISYILTEFESYLWICQQKMHPQMGYQWVDGVETEALKRVKAAATAIFGWIKDSAHIAACDFTLADIYAYHVLSWAAQIGLTLPVHVKTYLDRLSARPAFPERMRVAICSEERPT